MHSHPFKGAIVLYPVIAFWGCVSTMPTRLLTPTELHAAARDTCPAVSGYADLQVCRNGEKQQVLLTLTSNKEAFFCDVHAPLGMLIASIKATTDSVYITGKGFHATTPRNRPLDMEPIFLKIPISFNIFERIITGRLPRKPGADFAAGTVEQKGLYIRYNFMERKGHRDRVYCIRFTALELYLKKHKKQPGT
jgi:hypothetical protein